MRRKRRIIQASAALLCIALIAYWWLRPHEELQYPPGWPLAYVKAPDGAWPSRTKRSVSPFAGSIPMGAYQSVAEKTGSQRGRRTLYSLSFRSGTDWLVALKEFERDLKPYRFDVILKDEKRQHNWEMDHPTWLFQVLRGFAEMGTDDIEYTAIYISADNRSWVRLQKAESRWFLGIEVYDTPLDPKAFPILSFRKPIP